MSNPMVDEWREMLNSIETHLNLLTQKYYTDEIDETQYGFELHELLDKMPTPPVPQHNMVLARIKYWNDNTMLPAELVGPLREKVIKKAQEHPAASLPNPVALHIAGSSGNAAGSSSNTPADGSSNVPLDVDSGPPAAGDGDQMEVQVDPPQLGKRSASPMQEGGKKKMSQSTLVFKTGFFLHNPTSGRSSPLVPPDGRASPASISGRGTPFSGRSTPMEESDVPEAAPPPNPSRCRVKLSLRAVSGGAGVVAELSVEEVKIDALKNKRRRISPQDKQAILDSVAQAGSKKEAVAMARKTPGFEKLSSGQLSRWMDAKPHKKSGRPVHSEFEAEVLDELIFTQVSGSDSADQVEVVANVAYSYAVIKLAAETVQARPKWVSVEKLRKLKFSNPWIVGFLDRNLLRRRRITSTEKKLPPPAEIQRELEGIQLAITEGGYKSDEVGNGDETGVNFGAGPKNQYVPEGDARGTMPASDEKARFTDFLWGDSAGDMGEVFTIIQCTAKGPDLRNTRVLQNLQQKQGFAEADGWQLKQWQRELTLKVKKCMVTRVYYRPYLIHELTGHVITIQHRAWMDSVGAAMLFDLVIGPHYKKKRGKALLVWDNCGPHKVDAVKAVAAQWGIELKTLPPNMTDALQVMDLLVNAPIKARIRSARVHLIFDYFQSWKVARLQAQVNGTALPNFAPPKPTLAQGIMTMRSVHQDLFLKASFKESMKKCFIDCCYAKDHAGNFKTYVSHTRGKMNKHLFPPAHFEPELGNMAEGAAEVQLDMRADAEAEEEEEGGEEGEQGEGE